MSERNPDLLAVSATLRDLAAAVHEEKNSTTDFTVYQALNNELIEINHRIAMIGSLVFRARTEAITAAAARVEDGKHEVTAAIASIDKLNGFIETVSGFLGLVDDVIDIAKATLA